MSTSGKKTWNHRKSTTKFFSALEIKNNNDNQNGAENLTQLVSSSIVESPGHILRYHRLPLNVLIQNTPDFPSLFSLKELNPIAWRLEISKQFWSFASNIIPTSGNDISAQLQEKKILNRFRTLVYAHLKTSTAEFFESRDIIGPHISD